MHQMKWDWNEEGVLLFLALLCACHRAAISDIDITQPWHEWNLSLRAVWQVEGQLLDWDLLKTHYRRQLWKFSICLLQLKAEHHFPFYFHCVSIHSSTFEMQNRSKPCSLFKNICITQPQVVNLLFLIWSQIGSFQGIRGVKDLEVVTSQALNTVQFDSGWLEEVIYTTYSVNTCLQHHNSV